MEVTRGSLAKRRGLSLTPYLFARWPRALFPLEYNSRPAGDYESAVQACLGGTKRETSKGGLLFSASSSISIHRAVWGIFRGKAPVGGRETRRGSACLFLIIAAPHQRPIKDTNTKVGGTCVGGENGR